jgi:hypothetical protein
MATAMDDSGLFDQEPYPLHNVESMMQGNPGFTQIKRELDE